MGENVDYKVVTLRELQPLLRKKLGDELIVDGFTTDSLVQPGENYGSTIYSVHAVIRRNKNAEKEDLYLIAKMAPPTEFQKRIFDSPFTFRKESFMYEHIAPSYKQLEIEQGIPKDQAFDALPEYYGSRLSLDPNVDFDDDAVILLENLKSRGYYLANRSIGCDYDHSKLAIRSLAKFHALGVATKEKKPEKFMIIKKRSECLRIQSEEFKDVHIYMLNEIKNNEATAPYYERCEKLLNVNPAEIESLWTRMPKEPWATIAHCDCWVNNILFHRGKDGKVDDVKFIDFQNYLYYNPIREMIFFIFLSAAPDVQETYAEDLIDLYYKTFIDTLSKVGCDTEPFCKNRFEENIPEAARDEFMHISFMLKVVTLDAKETNFEVSKIKDIMLNYQGNSRYTQRLCNTVLNFVKRNWI